MPPSPPITQDRTHALLGFEALIQDGDELLDELTALASRLCETPISVVSLVDNDRQYFVGRTGLDVPSTVREHAFCAHAILSTDIFEIRDASVDPRFSENPLVTSAPAIRHYAGIPIVQADGMPLGTLCVINHTPGKLTPVQRDTLRMLGRQAAALLHMRRHLSAKQQDQRQNLLRAKVLHDLRPPLRSLSLLVRQLPRSLGNDTLNAIHQTADQLAGLADQLLDDASAAAQHSAQAGSMDVRVFLHRLAEEIRVRMPAHVALRTHVDETVPQTIQTHTADLYRILSNLLNNAIRFTDAGEICIGATCEPEAIVFEVSDTGKGIPNHQQEQVFQPFQGASPQHGGGTGLGLSIVQDLTQKLSGTLSLQSTEGKGSRFTLRIPLPLTPLPPRSRSVLLVEDVTINQVVARRALESAGFNVLSASNGLDALQLLEEHHQDIDAVLLDGRLPGLSGPDIAHRIRAQYSDTLSILGWSATMEHNMHQRFQDAGIHQMLNKPLTSDDISLLQRKLDD